MTNHDETASATREAWRARLTRWSVIFGAWTIFGLWAASQYHLAARVNGRPMESFLQPYKVLMASVWLWAALTPLIMAMARRFRIERPHVGRAIVIHIVLAALICAFDTGVDRLLRPVLGLEGPPPRFMSAFLAQFNILAFSYFVIVAITHAIDYAATAKERALRAARLENELNRAQLDVLRMQLQPHFLFNTLHAISELVHEDRQAADEMVTELAELLRVSIDDEGRQEIPLAEELEFLNAYIRIQQIRFRDRLNISTTVSPAARDALVPGLILQPLVENAIRHGLGSKVDGGRIGITAVESNGSLVIRIEDDGTGFPADTALIQEGVGLRNTRARLSQLYGAESRLTTSAAPEGGAVVELLIPLRSASADVRVDETLEFRANGSDESPDSR